MNWLAHLRLAPTEPLVRLGNLAGDFVRGLDLDQLPEPVRRGVAQHRALDRFVDAHPAHRRCRARLRAPWRRFGGVAADVFLDHFLARDWNRHGDGRPLQRFVDEVHGQLRRHRASLPPRLAALHDRMARHGWLTMYATLDGVDRVLVQMSQRSRRAAPLATVSGELRRCYGAFEADFEELWPAACAFASGADTAPCA